MELKISEVLSITGLSGLYKAGKRIKGGFVAISLIDDKETTITGKSHKVNPLHEISIYILDAELPLNDVFKRMNAYAGAHAKADADLEELKSYFKAIVPEYDSTKVFPADIRSIITWYNLLKDRVDFSN